MKKTETNFKTKVRNGTLYKGVEKLIDENFETLANTIQQYLVDAHLDLEVYAYTSTDESSHISNWGIEIDFDDCQWSAVLVKPHWMEISISLEEIEDIEKHYFWSKSEREIAKNNTLVLRISKFRNSFKLHRKEYNYNSCRNVRETHIALQDLENKSIIDQELKAVKEWIESIYEQFTKAIDTIDRNDLISYKHFEQIMEIEEKLKKLKAKDKELTLFGSEEHKYAFNKPLSKEEINAFESKHHIHLPEGYRHFLLDIGNGGAGPYYGLEPLSEPQSDLSKKFPHKSTWNEYDEVNEEEYFSSKWIDGFLKISNFGCGVSLGLVVNGDEYGTIWVDDRANGNGIYPDPYFEQKENERTTFLDWYEMWLEHCFLELEENE